MDKRRSRRHDVFSSTVVKNCNHFIKSFKGIYDSHLKQDMDAYGTFHEIYISQREIVKREGYHFQMRRKLIIFRVFRLQNKFLFSDIETKTKNC